MNNTRRTKTFIGAMLVAAASAAGCAAFASHSLHLYLAAAVLALAAATSRLKVKLPGVDGSMSVNLPFLLTAIVSLSAAEAMAITCVSTIVQCWPRKDAKFKPAQVAFNLSMMTLATALASLAFHTPSLTRQGWSSNPTLLALAAATLFLGQTAPVAVVVALSEGKQARSTWWNLAQLAFPYYVVSAGISSMVQTLSAQLGWELALAVFPVMYGIHRSYDRYFSTMVEAARESAPRPQILARAAGAGA